ncbi:MAG TPA: PAS domain-containing sensor histidine kinase [Chryseolinea sp.]|nr:PAS domain-containing sensor histidine kinase [Chryseolinea sp.]
MFQELIENSKDIIIVTDEDFKVRYISPAVVEIFGIEPISVVGRSIFDFIREEKKVAWKEQLHDDSSSFTDEIVVHIEGRKIYYDVNVSNLLEHENINGVVVKLHDISGKKKRERELIRTNQHLDQVIYKTTHDLRAPLMSALGLVNIAEAAPDEEKGQYIGLIKKSLLSLDSYIEEMNNFFRIEKLALQREQIDLRHIMEEAQENLRNFLNGEKVKVQLQIDSRIEWYSDPLRVKTIITNIFSNAIKYQDMRKSDPFIKIATRLSPEHCDITIEDNGIGIATDVQAKIFDLFFRGTDQSQGTGLGLFIVKDTIERLKGSIKVKSAVGKGTTFFIRIPNQLQTVEVA